MASVQKCALGLESVNDALSSIVNKALGYPRKGAHVGGGIHVPMPESWDGQGVCPPGWTKQASSNWVASALDSALPLPDVLANELQLPSNLSRISALEQATLLAALAARTNVDLEAGYVPKASAAVQAAKMEVK